MSDLHKRAIAFLQKRYQGAFVLNDERSLLDKNGQMVLKFWPMIALDMQFGVKQRAIAADNLGSKGEILFIAQNMENVFRELDNGVYVKMGQSSNPRGHEMDTSQMTFAPRVILYTNKLFTPIQQVIQFFDTVNTLIDVVEECEFQKTLFISYGGPDEEIVSVINSKIKSKGVRTWFFPDNAIPGDKLHRTMYEGVKKHDRVLLVCSKNSLTRPGVLNEVERVLEREAKEGGANRLIPITLDDFVYSDWAPERADLADQVRSRVITKITFNDEKQFDEQIKKIVDALHGIR